MQTSCTAFVKVVVNKKLDTYRILFTFDKHNRLTVRNAVLVTGDICARDDADAASHIARAIEDAKATLRCSNATLL